MIQPTNPTAPEPISTLTSAQEETVFGAAIAHQSNETAPQTPAPRISAQTQRMTNTGPHSYLDRYYDTSVSGGDYLPVTDSRR